MIEFLLAPQNAPFSTALLVVALLASAEGMLVVAGASLNDAVDGALPDADGTLGDALGLLGFGRAPAVVVIVCLLTAFGIGGLALQWLLSSSGLGLLGGWTASAAAVAAAIPIGGGSARLVARLLPKDESYAPDARDLIGAVGTLVGGNARASLPAEARFPDGHGGTIYVQVVPERDGETIPNGSRVIAAGRRGDHFTVVPARD